MSTKAGSAIGDALHRDIELRLAEVNQRYTTGRRQLVEALANASTPLDVPSILRTAPDIPLSSAYRSLSTLATVGVVRRISGTDDAGYFELSDDIVGGHHHHALCEKCGHVVDIELPPALEKALSGAIRTAGKQTGFDLSSHRVDLVGLCGDCK